MSDVEMRGRDTMIIGDDRIVARHRIGDEHIKVWFDFYSFPHWVTPDCAVSYRRYRMLVRSRTQSMYVFIELDYDAIAEHGAMVGRQAVCTALQWEVRWKLSTGKFLTIAPFENFIIEFIEKYQMGDNINTRTESSWSWWALAFPIIPIVAAIIVVIVEIIVVFL